MGRRKSQIQISLDIAIELCDQMNQFYSQYCPIRDGHLKYEEIVEQEFTYQLDFRIDSYEQKLRISQIKTRLTQRPPPKSKTTIPDVEDFRKQLAAIVEELSKIYLAETVVKDGELNKVVRGDRVAVIYSDTTQSCPWTHSPHPIEPLLFDPNLIALINPYPDVQKMRSYIQCAYSHLMHPSDSSYLHNQWLHDHFRNLKIRWIRRGQNFRINERFGASTSPLLLQTEDQWHTA